MRVLRLGILLLLVFLTAMASAQSPEQMTSIVRIPDLAGLTPPQAAAALNAARLQLGGQSSATASTPQAAGTIAGQIPPAGSTISAGAAVDVVVAYAPNVRLIYDNNDLTLINLSERPIDLRTVDLQASDAVPVRFNGQRWGRNVEPSDCVQVWSIRRTRPKSLAGCRRIESWLSTTDTSQHAWKQSAGVQRFMVRQDGVARGECPAADGATRDNPLACEIYLEQNQPAPVWPFIYLAYTQDTLVVHNTSGNQWMRLNASVTPARGDVFTLNDAALYRAIDRLVASGSALRQLAPGQCVRFRTTNAPTDTLPEPCLIFADTLVDDAPFWAAPFTLETGSDKHVCPAAMPDTVTTCRILR